MATGSNLQPRRGVVVSDATPGADFDTGEARLWDAAGRLAKSVETLQRPAQERQAVARGQEDAAALAAGEIDALPTMYGDLGAARHDAAARTYTAGRYSDFDLIETQIRAGASHSVETYRERMSAALSDFIQKADPEFAVDLENYGRRRINAGEGDVTQNVLAVSLREQTLELAGRAGNLSAQMADELAATGAPTVRYEILRDEWEELQRARLANPAIPYTEAEAAEDARELELASKAAVYTHHAQTVLRTEGAPAALATLREVLTDPDLQQSEVAVVFEKVRATLNTEIDLATDQANMSRSAQARAEEAMKRRIADSAAAVELGMASDGLTEGEVMAVLGPEGVRDWYRSTAEALERNREAGSLAGLGPDEAAARIADARAVAEGGGEFESLVDWIIDGSEGTSLVADDNGAGRARFGITERSHPEAWRDGDVTRTEAAAIYRRDYWDAIGAEGLAKDLRIVAFDAAINQGVGLAQQWIQESGGDAARFMDLRRAHYRALAASNPEKYGDDLRGWMNRLDAVSSRVQAMGAGNLLEERITNARSGFASNPQNFATVHRLAAPIDLDVDAVFQGGNSTTAWVEAMRARAALGGNLADQYGVPLRHFTDGEVAAYRDRFERDPASAILFAREATRALGPRGASFALAEVGQNTNASTSIHIADLATAGDARFSDQAAHGLTLRAAGQTLPTDTRDEIAEVLDRSRANFRNSPSLWQAVTNAAEAAALADHAAGVVRPAGYYVQAALGRSQWQGRSYGGTAQVNGADVLLPRWMNPERSEDALEALAESWAEQGNGPVYGNDEPMPARAIARMRLVMMPDGRYRLVDRDNRVAYSRSGRPLDLDLNVMRPFLTRTLGPSAVRPD